MLTDWLVPSHAVSEYCFYLFPVNVLRTSKGSKPQRDWLTAVLEHTLALRVLLTDDAPGSEGNSSRAGTPLFAASNHHAGPSNHIAFPLKQYTPL